jgi:ABC-2 type transport system ATP-binding protein
VLISDMTPVVDVKDLTKVYENKTRALDGVDLRVEAGKIFALLGPNGAGKTTLMRILTTQIKPTAGGAYVCGFDVVRNSSEVRKSVGYVPQEMSVWTDISGFENLLIYAKIYDIPSPQRSMIIRNALEDMGLIEFKDSLVRTYSGGMVRRLEIACALLIKPKILFLDEPTIGLDPSARKIVWEKLTQFRREYGATVFFNTHYMDEADLYSDEIGIISKGKIVKAGSPDSLKHSLGGEVIIFTLGGNATYGEIRDEIGKLAFVSDVLTDDLELRVIVENAETALPDVMEVLRREDVSVKKISLTKPTLDDVFLMYAGSKLDSDHGIREIRQVRSMIKRG